jgi:16S rRNA (adenine1518-N6/adenine1519-N6)-dimethyltransferase
LDADPAQFISALLKKYGLRPRKGLGQNFLVDPIHLDKIVEAAGLTERDLLLEIGPGPGTLTTRLAAAAGQVVAVELDPNMVNLLRTEYGHLPNLTIIEADILQTDLVTLLTPHLPNHPSAQSSNQPPNHPITQPPFSRNHRTSFQSQPPTYKVVANLPYYITSAVLRFLLESPARPGRVVVTVQREVAQRIVAQPGQLSLLAVSVQFYGQPQLVHRIPAGAFYPPPKVDSAVVRIDTFSEPPLDVPNVTHFFRIVRAGFRQKRKQLKNSLAGGLHKPTAEVVSALEQAGVDPARRAETLSLAEWGRLAEAMDR